MGTDLGLALSFAANSNAGLSGNNTAGALNVGDGLKLPQWAWLALIGGGFIAGLAWILNR